MKTIVTDMLAIVMSAVQVWGGSVGDAVEVRIVTDDGRTLRTYPVKLRSGIKKVYAEAVMHRRRREDAKDVPACS